MRDWACWATPGASGVRHRAWCSIENLFAVGRFHLQQDARRGDQTVARAQVEEIREKHWPQPGTVWENLLGERRGTMREKGSEH